MSIANSLEWANVEIELKSRLKYIKDTKNQMQARKVLNNIDCMVTKLSQLELSARTSPSHSLRNVAEQLAFINTEISNFEQWLTLLVLL